MSESDQDTRSYGRPELHLEHHLLPTGACSDGLDGMTGWVRPQYLPVSVGAGMGHIRLEHSTHQNVRKQNWGQIL